MSINIRKGLLRLWIVGSILFAVCIGIVSYGGIRDEFRFAYTDYDAIDKQLGGYSLVPVKCTKDPTGNPFVPPVPPPGYTLVGNTLRGVSGTDYNYLEADGLCWYVMPNFRRLYPEYKDLSDKDLKEKLYEKAGQPLKHFHPWQKLGRAVALAFGVPLAVLVLGWALFWAVSGFRAA